MKTRFWLCLALLLPGEDPGPLGPDEVARLGDRTIGLQEYKDFLYLCQGQGRLDDLLEMELLRQEAARLGLRPAPAELEALLAADVDKLRRERYRDDPSRMEAGLLEQGFSLAEMRRWLAFDLERRLLQERVIRATRQTTAEQVQRKFEELFGLGGVKVEIRQIQVSIGPLLEAALAGGKSIQEIDRAALEAQALARAREVKQLLDAGRPFHEVCVARSDEPGARALAGDPAAAQEAGRVPNYNYQQFGGAFAAAVRALEVGENSEPVAFRPMGGLISYHVIHLDRRVVTRLEEVRDQVLEALRAEAPTFYDRMKLRQSLLRSGRVQTRVNPKTQDPGEGKGP